MLRRLLGLGHGVAVELGSLSHPTTDPDERAACALLGQVGRTIMVGHYDRDQVTRRMKEAR